MSDPRPSAVRVTVNANKMILLVFFGWLALELFFVTIDTVINYNKGSNISQFRRMANLAREDGLATWFSSMQLLLVGMVATANGWRVRLDGGKWRVVAWALVALFFCYMAFDDGAKIHERVATGVKKWLDRGQEDGVPIFNSFPSYAWQVIFGPLFVGMGIFMAGFFWKELRTMKMRFAVLCALGCWAVAVGLDFIEGLEQEYDDVAEWLGVSSRWASHYGRVLEEFLEMFGTTVFLTTFLQQLAGTWGVVEISVRPGAAHD